MKKERYRMQRIKESSCLGRKSGQIMHDICFLSRLAYHKIELSKKSNKRILSFLKTCLNLSNYINNHISHT